MNRRHRSLLALAVLASAASTTLAQSISLTTAPYLQTFDNLFTTVPANNTTQSTPFPDGWFFAESGTGANSSYRVHNGSVNAGDTYLFGATSSNERALGGIASGTVQSTWGAQFFNANVGLAITSFSLEYRGEQWRDGGNATPVPQTIFFEYSLNATSLTSGTWNPVSALDFTSPTFTNTGGGAALDGNLAANQANLSSLVASSLNINPGQTFWIRWRDVNDPGNDHGLSVDDVNLTFTTGPALLTRNLIWDADTGTAGAQNGAGNWSNGGNNWIDPDASGAQANWSSSNPDNATFGTGSGAGAFTVTLLDSVTAGTVIFAASSPSYTITGGHTLNVGTALIANNDASIDADVNLQNLQTWTVASGRELTVGGDVSGATLIKAGTGTLNLAGTSNTFNGLQIDSGAVAFDADGSLGSGSLVLSGGTLVPTTDITVNREVRVTAASTINTNGHDLELAGDLIGPGSLTKVGNGTLILSNPSDPAPNNFTGNSFINGGTVKLTAESNFFTALGSGSVQINNGGTLEIANIQMGIPTGSAGARVFLNNGGTIVGTGSASYNRGGDALTIQNGTEANPFTVHIRTRDAGDVFTFGNSIRQLTALSDPINPVDTYTTIVVGGPGRVVLASGALTSTAAFAGSWHLTGGILQLGPIAAGSLPASTAEPMNALGFKNGNSANANPILVSGGILVGAVEQPNPNSGVNATPYFRSHVTLSGGAIASSGEQVDDFGIPNGTPVTSRWGGPLTVNSGSVLTYDPINGGPRAVSLEQTGNTTWQGTLVVDPGATSGGSFLINRSGGTATATATSTLSVLSGAGVYLSGANATGNATQGVRVNNAGTFSATSGTHSVGRLRGAGTYSISSGATVRVVPNGGDDATSVVTNLSVGGTLDLSDNDMIQRSGGPLGYSGIRSLVASGRNFGAWNGTGINSSAAASNPNQITGLGVVSGADYIPVAGTSFSGQTVSATDVLIKYTYNGDTDLNGSIDFDDYARIDTTFLGGGVTNKWFDGDFDYSDSVDFDDYALIDASFLLQGGPLDSGRFGGGMTPGGISAGMTAMDIYHLHAEMFGEGYINAFWSLVPEPSSLSLLGVAAVTILRRRR